jgi:hypothetical protein
MGIPRSKNLLRTLLALGALVLSSCSTLPPVASEPNQPGTSSRATTAPRVPGALPEMPEKPGPAEITFKGCPPEGDGGDPVLNRLKNRVDEGDYVPVDFDAVEQLDWPKAVERRDHSKWSAQDAAAIARYEGIPIAIEGYLAGARESEEESCNCHGAEHQFHDFHVWLTKTAGEDRTRSIVVEPTPRVRVKHRGWTTEALNRIVKNRQKVRISGWLMFDPEHPDQVGKTRGTIWEIHPVMRIEVQQRGQWVTLDSLAD